MTRESKSRPKRSAPNGCCQLGGASDAAGAMAYGLAGAITGARIAVTTKKTIKTREMNAGTFRRSARQNVARRAGADVPARVAADTAVDGARPTGPDSGLLVLDPRVNEAVAQICDQVDDDERDGQDDHAGLHLHVIAAGHRVHQQAADPGPRENRLDHHGAPHHLPRVEPQNTDHRQ